MSFYHTLFAGIAAVVIASPVFSEELQSKTENNAIDQSAQQTITTTETKTTESTTTVENKVNLNKASAKDLMKVKGINAAKARAIVAYRKKHGEFKSVDELAKVKGFAKLKTVKLKEIQDQVFVN